MLAKIFFKAIFIFVYFSNFSFVFLFSKSLQRRNEQNKK